MTAARELNGCEFVKAVTTCHLACIERMTHGTNRRANLKVMYFDGNHYIWVSLYMNLYVYLRTHLLAVDNSPALLCSIIDTAVLSV